MHNNRRGANLHIIEVGNVLVSPDIFTEEFCCDLDKCKGACCVEGDAGAPLTLDEIGDLEESLNAVWHDMTASAQSVVDRQGVAYTDTEGELVTSIVGGKDCVFTCRRDLTDRTDGHTIKDCCLCALECACNAGKTHWPKPISCALYPIREKQFNGGLVGLNYHRWNICKDAVKKGRELQLPLYVFLKEPLVRRFGDSWYQELCDIAEELKQQGLL